MDDIKLAVYAAKIISYAQGFMEMREAAKEHKWNLNYPSIALMWRGGCIIRRYSVYLAFGAKLNNCDHLMLQIVADVHNQ